MKQKPTTPKAVVVRLVGQDGNAFAIIGRVTKALRTAGFPDDAKQFSSAAFACGSYDELLRLCMDTIDAR